MHAVFALTVIFAGVYNQSHSQVEQRVAEVLSDVKAKSLEFDPVFVRAMAEQRPAAGAVVRKIAVGTVVVGREEKGGVEVLVWNDDGTLRGRVFIDLTDGKLDAAGVAKLRASLIPLVRGEAAPPTELPEEEQAYELRTTIGFGLGVESRAFSPPPAIPAYSSSAVPMGLFLAKVEPLRWFAARLSAEAALSMTSDVSALEPSASTSLTRWDALVVARWRQLEAGAGYGQRRFAIDSKDSARSPDGDYQYFTVELGGRLKLGRKLEAAAQAAFEPVVSGSEPMVGYGTSRRWGLDVAVALELHATSWLTVQAQAGYQRFFWTFPQSDRAGGASDGYLSAAFFAAASY